MIIVAGHLTIDAERRESYLETCTAVVEAARRAPGCLDFAVTADLIEPGRVCIYERWESRAELDDFRGSGPDDGQAREIRSMKVSEYLVPDVQPSNE
ncbi:antibiotic biosynthesis monooxygenase [Rhodococcus pyridinivorans KG-16]|uniref:Antibiotic biosynthesis monooxygenase n=1 Tax=Rhodococcus pyridinivorans KG-16 TaxID=1441730 RepID=A0A0V9UK34_9NOCA|nr:antibiotic biosynthesis monooxygenase family protein [Rhodococcus pyridinivorans]KSZ58348.1 antibiotic biosynthesis monooxygenase [Rhodococcus pyridinivorans KG-16]